MLAKLQSAQIMLPVTIFKLPIRVGRTYSTR
jgi:hypothetical protein